MEARQSIQGPGPPPLPPLVRTLSVPTGGVPDPPPPTAYPRIDHLPGGTIFGPFWGIFGSKMGIFREKVVIFGVDPGRIDRVPDLN